jgi:hypothetical protein
VGDGGFTNPEYVCDLQPIDFAAVARGFGAASFAIDDPKRCVAILDQALATEGPVAIEAVVDPNTPSLPAKIKANRAMRLAERWCAERKTLWALSRALPVRRSDSWCRVRWASCIGAK